MERLLSLVGVSASCGRALAPTFRPDISREADLAEEIARLYGYGRIPETLTSGEATTGKLTRRQAFDREVKDGLCAAGFCEALTFAFESPKACDKLLIPDGDPLRRPIRILNPLGEDYSVMRRQTANAMLTALSTNIARRNETAALFELAKTYAPSPSGRPTPANEASALTIGAYGGGYDFFVFKGVLESLFARLNVSGAAFSPAANIPYYHPGRAAAVTVNGTLAGVFGEVHPDALENYEIGERAYLAEIDADALFGLVAGSARYVSVPRFPAVNRDIAVVAEKRLRHAEIEAIIRESGGGLIEDVKLFDVYCGAGVPEGKKSMAYSITFRAPDRTLKDEDAAEAVKTIVSAIKEKTGAELRTGML
jgi:phenylalanyl-tRNA synthetase beta chain